MFWVWEIVMRFFVSGMLLAAILICSGCTSAKGRISIPKTEQKITPETAIELPAIELPDMQDAVKQLIQELLKYLCLNLDVGAQEYPPVVLIGMPEGLKYNAEECAETISALLLNSACVYLAAPIEQGKRPSLPVTPSAAEELARISGAAYFLRTLTTEQAEGHTVTLALIELSSLNAVWIDMRTYKKDIDKEWN